MKGKNAGTAARAPKKTQASEPVFSKAERKILHANYAALMKRHGENVQPGRGRNTKRLKAFLEEGKAETARRLAEIKREFARRAMTKPAKKKVRK